MKTLATLLLVLAIGFVAKADEKKGTEWPALKEFHSVMAATFHPAEEGNLKPARSRAGELVKKAEALSQGEIPAAYNTPQMQEAIKRLQLGTREVKAVVDRKGDDAELTKRLTVLHDIFHEIAGMCRKSDSHDGESHEGHNHDGHTH